MTIRSLIRAAAAHNGPGRGEIARVAAATAKHHNIANAIHDDYVPTNTCAELWNPRVHCPK